MDRSQIDSVTSDRRVFGLSTTRGSIFARHICIDTYFGTFLVQVSLIWFSEWTIGKALYFAARYVVFIPGAMSIFCASFEPVGISSSSTQPRRPSFQMLNSYIREWTCLASGKWVALIFLTPCSQHSQQCKAQFAALTGK